MDIPVAAIKEANIHLQLLHTKNVDLEANLQAAKSENKLLAEQVKSVEAYANNLRNENAKVSF